MVVSDMLAGGGDGAGNTLGNYTLPTIDPDTLGSQSKNLSIRSYMNHEKLTWFD